MEISDDLRCLYSARVEADDGRYHVEVPAEEVAAGAVEADTVYRVALLPATTSERDETEPERTRGGSSPPVETGEQRTVDIEDIGEQGDGIARVERGYVVIVPDTELGERVRVELTDVQANVGFADVVERKQYYE